MDISNHKEKIRERSSLHAVDRQEELFNDLHFHFTPLPKHIILNGTQVEIQHKTDWDFTNNNQSFSLQLFLIDKNILLNRMKGIMTPPDASQTYQIIKKFLNETKLTHYHYIEDINKLQLLSRQTRNRIKKLDVELEPGRISTKTILPKKGQFMYEMFNKNNRKNATSSSNINEAIHSCIGEIQTESTDKKNTLAPRDQTNDLSKASKKELIEKIEQLEKEKTALKSSHRHRISYLADVLGQNLWNDSSNFQMLNLLPEDDFHDLYEAFSILLKDLHHLQDAKHAKSTHDLVPAIDRTSALLLTLDLDLSVLNFNKAFKTFIETKYQKKVDKHQHLLEVLPLSTHPKWKDLLKKIGEGQSVQMADQGYFDVQKTEYNITVNPIFNKKLEVTSIALFALPIDNKEFNNHEQFQLLSEKIGDLVCMLTPNEMVTYVTPSVVSILGYTEKEIIGKSIFRYIHPEDTSQFLSSNSTNFFLRDNKLVEFRMLKNDNSYVWMEAVTTPVKTEEGELTHIVVSARENAKKRQLEYQLRMREEELKSTLVGMSESVYVFDKNGILFTTNQQKNKDYFIERRGDDLIGKAYQDIFADPFIQKLDKAIRIACTTQIKHEFEYIVKRAEEDNAPDFYKIFVLARKDMSGNYAGITLITRNVTASKRLKDQNVALEKANEELDRFVYSASHDLRAPLASTLGLINITRISDDSQEKINYLNLMEASLNKMDRYIHDITDYSRNARLSFEFEKIEFDELTNDTIQTLSYHENTSKIHFLVNKQDSTPFYSDYSRLNIIFRNVISNAVKYHDLTRPNPYLSIDIKITKQEGVFCFEDNGIGIEAQYIDKIFNMFYKASPESFGSGLGLYIVQEALNKLQGKIKVISTPGQGSTFTITIPNYIEKLS